MTDERKFNPELCLERSAECQRLSKVVIRSEHQVALLHMAETWARLAERVCRRKATNNFAGRVEAGSRALALDPPVVGLFEMKEAVR